MGRRVSDRDRSIALQYDYLMQDETSQSPHSPSETMCPLLWNGLTVNAAGTLRPCCRYMNNDSVITSFKESALSDALNDSHFESARQTVLDGKPLKACERCYKEERAGLRSLRQSRLNALQKNFSSVETKLMNVEYMELFLGRKCNLACHSCYPHLSTRWEAEFKKMGLAFQPNKDFSYGEFDLSTMPDLKELKFVGGETFIDETHHSVISTIKPEARNKITLDYYTNGTFPLKDHWFETWKDFKQVIIRFSIDGYKELNDYIRYPSRWHKIEENIRNAISTPRKQVTFRVQSTISIFNVFSYKKIINWWDDLTTNSSNRIGDVKLNLLDEPTYMSIGLLKMAPELMANIDLPDKWTQYIQNFKADQNQIIELKTYLDSLDNHRRHDFSKVVSELDLLFRESPDLTL